MNESNSRKRAQEHTIDRFLLVQEPVDSKSSSLPSHAKAMKDLRSPPKTKHWIWYIFPQIDLSDYYPISGMSRKYAIKSMSELKSYVEEQSLQRNYIEGLDIVLGHFGLKYDPQSNAIMSREEQKKGPVYALNQIFSYIDCAKFVSSVTLFAECGIEEIEIRCRGILKNLGKSPDANTLDAMRKKP